MSALLLMLGFYVLAILLMAFMLWLAAKLFKFNASSFVRALAITLILFFLVPLTAIPLLYLPENKQLPYSILALAIQIVFTWYLIKRIHRTTTGRAWAGFGFYAAAQIVALVVALLLIRPFLVEAFSLPTNGMSPTLRGPHQVIACPNCGGQLLVEWSSSPMIRSRPTHSAICASCYRVAEIPAPDSPVISSDHFLVTKFLSPRRWDVVAHRRPSGDIFLQRIVGLPNETVAIDRQGQAIINGANIGSPPNQSTLTFPWPENFQRFPEIALTPETSLKLGPAEYFVIGDNSTHSYDSRSFGPIHAADIVGITTMIYWSPNRIKIIR